ncbi:hypothetical protein MMC09_002635 [Bachmanniomyces sp. S44760]|nr:hypothetical protein [Bachmanniomyces sp. S44760]
MSTHIISDLSKGLHQVRELPKKDTSNGHVTSTPTMSRKSNGSIAQSAVKMSHDKYRHIAAVHSRPRSSVLSHDTNSTPSFLGFRNLMVIVLIVMNLRLVVENFMKASADIILGALLYAIVPCHLFAAYIIELVASQHAKGVIGRRKRSGSRPQGIRDPKERQGTYATWRNIAFAHSINATLGLLVTTLTVYFHIHHPLIGTISMLHAIIVWLKVCSYAFTNRDLRHALLNPSAAASLPEIYAQCPYPKNITLANLSYFWWAPTLVYQPVYPRSPRIRWLFVAKRLAETAGLSVFIWLASAQYAAPVLRNSLTKIAKMDITSILERLMKLSTISLVIWLAGFFAVFQSLLNALAEIMKFGDREFYTDWWNSPSVGTYWRTWNTPVYHFMKRHVYSPLVGRGWSSHSASAMVFLFSGVLHELLVGIPTHNILGKRH